jgi:hypothetical protein
MSTILFSHDEIGDAVIKIKVYLHVLGIYLISPEFIAGQPLGCCPLGLLPTKCGQHVGYKVVQQRREGVPLTQPSSVSKVRTNLVVDRDHSLVT